MDLLPQVTNWIVSKLAFDDIQGINENFNSYGYSSLYAFENYGSATLIFVIVPVVLVLAKLIEITKISGLSEAADKLYKSVCWNGVLGYFFEMYLVLTMCGLMNLYYIRFDSTANVLNLLLTVIFLSVSVLLPIFYGYFYFKNLEAFIAGNKKIKEKYGVLVEELNYFRKGKAALVYPLVVMVRKLLLTAFILIFLKKPLFACFVVNFTSLATGIILGWN